MFDESASGGAAVRLSLSAELVVLSCALNCSLKGYLGKFVFSIHPERCSTKSIQNLHMIMCLDKLSLDCRPLHSIFLLR